jgi:hypothetical protein
MTVRRKSRDCQRAHGIGAEIELPEVACQLKKVWTLPEVRGRSCSRVNRFQVG